MTLKFIGVVLCYLVAWSWRYSFILACLLPCLSVCTYDAKTIGDFRTCNDNHLHNPYILLFSGPMTVPLVSTNSNPPIPLPMQVPQGHVVQQIVDENGTLRHIIVSHQPHLIPIPFVSFPPFLFTIILHYNLNYRKLVVVIITLNGQKFNGTGFITPSNDIVALLQFRTTPVVMLPYILRCTMYLSDFAYMTDMRSYLVIWILRRKNEWWVARLCRRRTLYGYEWSYNIIPSRISSLNGV